MFLQHLCTPALVYLVIGLVIAAVNIVTKGKMIFKLKLIPKFVFGLAFMLFITYLLDYVCKIYGVTNSWYALAFIYLFPIIVGLLTFIVMVGFSKK